GDGEVIDPDEGAGREVLAELLLAQLDEAVAVAHVGQEDRHGDDVGEFAPCLLHGQPHVLPHLRHLGVEVVHPDQLALGVHGRHAGQEYHRATGHLHGRREGAAGVPGRGDQVLAGGGHQVRASFLPPRNLRSSHTMGSKLSTMRSFMGMMPLSVMWMCSGHTSVQHLVMLQRPTPACRPANSERSTVSSGCMSSPAILMNKRGPAKAFLCSSWSRMTWHTSWHRKHSMHLCNSWMRSMSSCIIR